MYEWGVTSFVETGEREQIFAGTSSDDAEGGLTGGRFAVNLDRLHSGVGRPNAAPLGQRRDGHFVAFGYNLDRSVDPVANGAGDTEAIRFACA